MSSFAHVSAYRFVEIDEPNRLRDEVFAFCEARAIRGTFLLAHEGINFCMAGEPNGVRELLAWLEADPRFAALDSKWSDAQAIPYGKLRVRVKGEIIRMNSPQIRPVSFRAPAVDAETLRTWLDRGHDDGGREVVMLDTRNAFELEHGAFDNAIEFGIAQFSQFPEAAREHREALAGKTIVTYCTGGIRCEKAALVLTEMGYENVLQLDGGILRYFEQQGAAHYHGTCFVFDERRAIGVEAMRPQENV